ncbi:hypothetical protein ACFWZ7_25480 [Nocardiopsis alba]|uniref:hypothetical protein n=1 Tax=Nocardiopsis alba TaxID=53437 RepID=UPI00366E36B2
MDEGGYYGDRFGYQNYGSAGTQLHVITSSCVDPKGMQTRNSVADNFWGATQFITEVTIFVYQLSASDSILDWLSQSVAKFVLLLRDGLWRPLLPTVFILSAITLGWWGLVRKRATLTMQGAVWMVAATTLGIFMTSAPHVVMAWSTNVTNWSTVVLHDALGETIFQGGTCPESSGIRRIPFQGTDGFFSGTPEYYGPESSRGASGGGFPGQAEADFAEDAALWKNTEMIYSAFLCQPWIMAVFGESAENSEAARLYSQQALSSGAISRFEMDARRDENGNLDRVAYQEMLDNKEEDYRAISEQIGHYYPEVWGAWSGHDAQHRMTSSFVAFFGAFLGGLLIFILSVSTIVYKAGFLLFLLLSPFVLLVGIHPGMGQRIVHKYIELLLGFQVLAIFAQFLLVIYLSLYGILVTSDFGWGVKIVMMVILYVLMFVGRKHLARGIAAMAPGTMGGRIMSRVADDKTIRNASNLVPGVAAYKADKKAREKLSPLVGQIAGTALGGPAGAKIGEALGKKNADRLGKKKDPAQAPPMPTPSAGGSGPRTWARETPRPTPSPSQAPDLNRALPGPPRPAVGSGGTPPGPSSPPPAPAPSPGPGGGTGPRPAAPAPARALPSRTEQRPVVVDDEGGRMIIHRPNLRTQQQAPQPSQTQPQRVIRPKLRFDGGGRTPGSAPPRR